MGRQLRIGFLAVGAMLCAAASSAAIVDVSLRPMARPGTSATIAPAAAPAEAPLERSLLPRSRPAALDITPPADPAKLRGLERWLRDFRGRARRAGVSLDTLDTALKGVRYNPLVISRDQNQSEFVKPIWDYLASAASEERVRIGSNMLRHYAALLDRIEARYGVEKEVVVAVWGMESAYGRHRGNINVIEALATLAYDGRRGAFFEQQLIAALKIVQNGDIPASAMTGSWAGAMGHTQFIPTSYEAYAVDFTGDGRRDIWSDDPADALASTAAYLSRFGWRKGQLWGAEVSLPSGFDYSLAGSSIRKSSAEWSILGLRRIDGGPLPDHGEAALLLPAGAYGAAFLTFRNFRVIKRYNAADAYALGVGHLSDRIMGGPPIRASWPTDDRALTFAERKELQRRLSARGFRTGGVDGRIGPNSERAIRDFQRSIGRIPDGHASFNVLEALR